MEGAAIPSSIAMGIGSFILFAATWWLLRSLWLLKYGRQVMATVRVSGDSEQSRGPGVDFKGRGVVVEFTTPDGRTHRVPWAQGYLGFSDTGTTVPVLYDPRNPSRSMVHTFKATWKNIIQVAVIGCVAFGVGWSFWPGHGGWMTAKFFILLFPVGGAFFSYLGLRGWLRQRRRGRQWRGRADGTVVGHQRSMRMHGGAGYRYAAIVEYRSADGALHTFHDDISLQSPLPKGMPVVVYYDPSNPRAAGLTRSHGLMFPLMTAFGLFFLVISLIGTYSVYTGNMQPKRPAPPQGEVRTQVPPGTREVIIPAAPGVRSKP